MTADQAVTQVCRNLTGEVARIAPPGIGCWEAAWSQVAEADVEFMTALVHWKKQPSPESKLRVRTAYHELLDRWREAIREYETQDLSNAHPGL